MNVNDKLEMIRDICRHPGSFHWTGRQMAKAISNVIEDEEPIAFILSDIDRPIPFEVVHDAVYEGIDE